MFITKNVCIAVLHIGGNIVLNIIENKKIYLVSAYTIPYIY